MGNRSQHGPGPLACWLHHCLANRTHELTWYQLLPRTPATAAAAGAFTDAAMIAGWVQQTLQRLLPGEPTLSGSGPFVGGGEAAARLDLPLLMPCCLRGRLFTVQA